MPATIEAPGVAKKKAKAPDTGWLDKPKKPVVAQVRGSDAYKAWLDRLCRAEHRKVSDLFEYLLARYAREIKFEEPPPR